jgi:hypothetical protein
MFIISHLKSTSFSFLLLIVFTLFSPNAFASSVFSESQINTCISFKGKKVILFEAFHLPSNYPSGMVANEKVFSGEIYTTNVDDNFHSNTVFVPNDYSLIIQAILLALIKIEEATLVVFPSSQGTSLDNSDYILLVTPVDFKVLNEMDARVTLSFILSESKTAITIWKGQISKTITSQGIPSSLEGNLIVTFGTHRYNFHPQRALLADAAYKCIQEFLSIVICPE